MRRMPRRRLRPFTLVPLVLGATLVLSACTGGSASAPAAPRTAPAGWAPFRHVAAVVDLTEARSDGRLVVAAAGRLQLLDPNGVLTPFAQGNDGYATTLGTEAYLVLSTGREVGGAGCAFPRDAVYAIESGNKPGVVQIDAGGVARRFAELPGVQPNGITFDRVGRFGYQLLVTAGARGTTSVVAFDCTGKSTTITSNAPPMEGGIAVAPASFGAFGGDLVGPDENTGNLWAVTPDGRSGLVARSPLANGGDIGVESEAFVPNALLGNWVAYVADRRTPGNPHPGSDNLLRVSGLSISKAGVLPGDLVVASEGGAVTIAVHCAAQCTVRHLFDGPPTSHGEGHIVFSARHAAPGT